MDTFALPELDSITSEAISIIIPVFNALGQVEGLLTRLRHFAEKYGTNYQFIIADDASTDGTGFELPKRYPFIEVVRGDHNVGFGQNVNRAAASARHNFLAVVNSDIELVGNPFKELIHVLRSDPKCFAVMPMVYNRRFEKIENMQRLCCAKGLAWSNDLPVASEWSDTLSSLLLHYSATKERLRDISKDEALIPSVLCGAFFTCRTAEFDRMGGFSPRMSPFYWEDVELDYRARRGGQYCCVLPNSAVIHRHSETIDRHHGRQKDYYFRINQLRFAVDYQHELPGLSQPHIWWGLRAIRELFGGDPRLVRAYWRAGLGRLDV